MSNGEENFHVVVKPRDTFGMRVECRSFEAVS